MARRRLPSPPVPPMPVPPGRTVLVPDRGEFFVRDSGGDGPAVLLVHGWMFPSDLNWLTSYAPLRAAGYRVLAMDLRGHGRGLRSADPFRLADRADDAAGVLDRLDVAAALVVGYSMGGPRQRAVWRAMGELVQPRAVVVMTLDRLVPPREQRVLAGVLDVEPLLLSADHDACSTSPQRFVAVLLQALETVSHRARRSA